MPCDRRFHRRPSGARLAAIGSSLLLVLGLAGSATVDAQELQRASPEDVGLSSERLTRVDRVFQSFVDDGRIAGAVGMVLRDDRVAYSGAWGYRDVESGEALEEDDIFRLYSMTKPVTAVAALILYEEGHFLLTDPVARYLPELANMEVVTEGATPENPTTEPARRPITIQDLFRHTSGISYGSLFFTVVDRIYRRNGVGESGDLAEMVRGIGEAPLLYHPGTRWHYSWSIDVLARLVEVVSGQSFDAFLEERIFEPLGMVDTGHWVPEEKHDRLAEFYGHTGPDGALERAPSDDYLSRPELLAGGTGLVSTARDYARFALMLANGGELEGVRILGRTTVDLMRTDHLGDIPANAILDPGWGWGLGVTVKKEAGLDAMPGSVGSYYWWGVGGSSFWIDPEEDFVGVFLIHIRPNRDLTFRDQFKTLVYQALVD